MGFFAGPTWPKGGMIAAKWPKAPDRSKITKTNPSMCFWCSHWACLDPFRDSFCNDSLTLRPEKLRFRLGPLQKRCFQRVVPEEKKQKGRKACQYVFKRMQKISARSPLARLCMISMLYIQREFQFCLHLFVPLLIIFSLSRFLSNFVLPLSGFTIPDYTSCSRCLL